MRNIILTALAALLLVPTAATAQTWQEYRQTNAEVFRLPAYVAPRGMSARPVSVGAQLVPAFYAEPYRIDFATYRLPRPGAQQQYVRYRNDVLLTNIRTGRVVRVFRDFFL